MARAAETLPSTSIKRDKNTVLVIWGARHGNRNPERFLDQQPKTWGFEGELELTCWGKMQAYGLGLELKSFIGDLCSPEYDPEEVEYYSSSASRCKKTTEIATAAFHQTKVTASPPFTVDDHLLRMYSLSPEECPQVKEVWDPITWDRLPSLAITVQEKRGLLDYLEKETGWAIPHLGVAADIADNLMEIELYKAEYPTWMERPTLTGYTTEKLKKEILELSEIHQITCANHQPARDLMCVNWLAHILKAVENSMNENGPKVVGYASHTEIVLSVMKVMGVDRDDLPSSAGFIMEFRKIPTPSIRILNHDPNPLDKHVIHRAGYLPKFAAKADGDGFIPLGAFVEEVSPVLKLLSTLKYGK